MGFFKEFKDDLSQAVNELLPEDELVLEEAKLESELKDEPELEDQLVNTLDMDESALDEAADNEKMKEWLDEFAQKEESEMDNTRGAFDELQKEDSLDLEENKEDIREDEGNNMDDNIDLDLLDVLTAEEEAEKAENKESAAPRLRAASSLTEDAVTVITKGTTINGSISSEGSLDIMGTITGDIDCLGKLTISGKVIGNSSAAEIYVNCDRLEGNVISEGSVKIGLGTVVIGDITGTEGVIAGAVKGEVDINGPIVIDSTAIIKGNIKAKAVQINNGAVIEGFCSLSYSDINVDNIFE
ncbi:MAG: polymer-forming cytoskeletal protein [Mobilitalea sp.]